MAVCVTNGLEDLRDALRLLEAAEARAGEIRRRLAAGESVRAVARALRYGLAAVQWARSAGAMRGAPRPVSGSGPEYGAGARAGNVVAGARMQLRFEEWPSLAPPRGLRRPVGAITWTSRRALREAVWAVQPALLPRRKSARRWHRPASFLTLTYPLEDLQRHEADPRLVKRHLHQFWKRVDRAYPESWAVWVLEHQRNGNPHVHLGRINFHAGTTRRRRRAHLPVRRFRDTGVRQPVRQLRRPQHRRADVADMACRLP